MANENSNNAGADIGMEHPYSLHRDLRLDFKVNYVVANLPFNVRDWEGERLRAYKHLALSTCQLGCIV